VDLLLNRPTNDIQVECPFPLEDESQRHLTVRCKQPEAPGTLRVLLVNAGADRVTDEDLIQRARAALQLEGQDNAALHSRVFDRVVLYPNVGGQPNPLSRRVTREKVRYWLQVIQKDVERDARAGKRRGGDIVLVYWLGKDLVADERGDWYLPTSDTAREPDKSPAVTGQPVRPLLDDDHEVPGARVVLLDLADDRGASSVEADLARSRAGVLRYVWQKDPPVPGLLDALWQAAHGQGPVSLEDWGKKAGSLAGSHYQGAVRLTERLPEALGGLVVAEPMGR